MSKREEIEFAPLEKWVREGLYFAEILLCSEELAQQIVEKASIHTVKKEDWRAKGREDFFRELNELCLAQLSENKQAGTGQLELFEEVLSKTQKTEQEKNTGIARARAFLSVNTESFVEPGGELPQKEDRARLLVEFCNRLSMEKYGELEPDAEIRHKELSKYLLGLLDDELAMEVERNCRQHTDWQRDKVWLGTLLGWMDKAWHDYPQDCYEIRVLEIDRKTRVLDELSPMSNDPKDRPSNLDTHREGARQDSPKRPTKHPRDNMLIALIGTGLFASVVGFFGWKEYEEKRVEQKITFSEENQTVGEGEKIISSEDWEEVAAQAARDSADRALAKQMAQKIEELSARLDVPKTLLPNNWAEGNETVTQDLPPKKANKNKTDDSLTNGARKRLRAKALKQALNSSSGQVFLPGKEALGKVVQVQRGNESFLFTRADWANPEKSYALAVTDYELRMGAPSLGFVILSGEVKRTTELTEDNNTRPRYQLRPTRAWWLDSNQSRKRIELGEVWAALAR